MNCPYCNRKIHAFTGLQEAQKFAKHLNRCGKRPRAIDIQVRDADTTVCLRPFNLNDALEIRHRSGQ